MLIVAILFVACVFVAVLAEFARRRNIALAAEAERSARDAEVVAHLAQDSAKSWSEVGMDAEILAGIAIVLVESDEQFSIACRDSAELWQAVHFARHTRDCAACGAIALIILVIVVTLLA